jgi:hypothetical protein
MPVNEEEKRRIIDLYFNQGKTIREVSRIMGKYSLNVGNIEHGKLYIVDDNYLEAKLRILLDMKGEIGNNNSRIFIDGANPSFIHALKDRVDEDPEYDKQISFYKKNYPSVYDLQFLQQNMFVIPVAFGKEHKHMLAHCKEMLEYHNGQVAINPRHSKLKTALRTAVENGEGALDKEATSHNDLFDSFRLSLMFWH